eukprot:TRINITY_DN7951_c0_g3_i1.p1 TRINITY_DN7951_c0_g3~~TRINITY_DN7951_c0_g3_i1.p1  ORF type:complete len:233 (-),score=50.11 TRINITY_DN7951_c0_g3_i1:49-747(-)
MRHLRISQLKIQGTINGLIMRNCYLLLLISFCLNLALCTNGVTVRSAVSNFTCFKKQNYVFAMLRGYLSIGKVDPSIRKNLIAGNAAKMLYIDVFMNPCLRCSFTPEEQVRQLVKEVKDQSFSMLYVMVQRKDKWPPNKEANCRYINRFIDEIARNKLTPGVGSDYAEWNHIMGSSCRIKNSNAGCWWDRHDKVQSLNNFKPFGGFTFPMLKEYDGSVNMCGVDVDLDFCNC